MRHNRPTAGRLFSRLTSFAQKHAVQIFAVTAIITVVLGYYAAHIRIVPDVGALLPTKSEAMQLAADLGETSSPEYVLLAVESPTLLEGEKLAALSDAITRIEALPTVHGSVNPFNFMTFEREGRRVMPALLGPGGKAPGTPEELDAFRRRITTDPLARNMVISADGTTLCCFFPVTASEDYAPLLTEVRTICSGLERYYTVHLGGSPALMELAQKYVKRDIPRLLAAAIVVVLGVFFLGFGSKRSFLLPLLVVGLGTLWTMGIMTLMGMNLSIVSLMVPPLVLVLGSSYSIHVLTQYYRDAHPDSLDRSWVPESVARIVQTVFLAAATDVFGFLGLLTAEIRQIKEFGIAASIGIVLCAVLALFFFPAVLSRLRPLRQREVDRVEAGRVARIMARTGRWVVKWRYAVLASLPLIGVGSALTIGSIRYDSNYLSYFRRKEMAVEDTRFVIRKIGGYLTVRLTLTAPENREGYFLDPAVQRRLAALEDRLRENPDASYISSFTSYLKAYNRALTGSSTIPESRTPILALARVVRGALSTEAGRELVGELVNDSYSRVTLVVRVWDSKREGLMYEDGLTAFSEEAKRVAIDTVGAELDPVVWGPTLVAVEVSEQLARDQLSSTIISALLIFALTAFSFRSVKYGLYTLVTAITGILLNLLLMALFSIPLDVVTVMFTSVSLGVGVDSSIHVIIEYREQRKKSKDHRRIIEETLRTAGRPILHTTASLIAGMLVLTVSSFRPISYFGALISLAVVTTSAGALVLLPAILSVELRTADWLAARKKPG